jgi:hypothetical protein
MQATYPSDVEDLAGHDPLSTRLGTTMSACASRTLDALETRGHLGRAEREQIEAVHMESLASGKGSEVFETITRLSTVPPREIPDFIAGLGLAVAKTLRERVLLMPNLARLAVPGAFYNAFPDVAMTARALLTPVLYSEDNEVIGIGSVNPIPALRLAQQVTEELPVHTGFTPFVSVVRLDYETWRTLLERHFSL